MKIYIYIYVQQQSSKIHEANSNRIEERTTQLYNNSHRLQKYPTFNNG